LKRRSTMAKKRPAAQNKGGRRAMRQVQKDTFQNLRQTLIGLGLWGLGIINVVFIASMVMKYVPSTGEETISVVEQIPNKNVVQNTVIQIEILNGCGEKGIAAKFADFLKNAGAEPVNVGNWENFNMPATSIIDRKSRNKINGIQIAEALGLPSTAVMYQASDIRDVDVTVVIGNDYSKIDFLRR